MERISSENRSAVNQFILEHWYTTKMIVRGAEIDMTATDGFFISDGGEIVGLVTYVIHEGIMEILSLDSLRENRGLGSKLLQAAIEEAKLRRCGKIILITTNDNINALRFYQKRGFDMARLYRNAMDVSRKMKPEIPLIGENGIALKHEIEFEMIL